MHITHIEHREAIPNDEMLVMLRETKPTAFESSEPLLYGGSFFFLQRKDPGIDELARSSLEALVSTSEGGAQPEDSTFLRPKIHLSHH